MRKNVVGGIWKYLDELGVLEKGSYEEIKAAKKAYRKKYNHELKQELRKKRHEYSVQFSIDNRDHARIIQAAKTHKLAATPFIRQAALAYIDRKYIVPNREQVADLEQLLSDCLNEIKVLVSKKERFFWDREQKLNAIEKRIVQLEAQIHQVFRNPPLLYDRQNQIA